MGAVQLKLVNCTEGNCGEANYSKLFDQINKKLYKFSKLEYNNLRFFLKKKISCNNKDAFEQLSYYREILTRKIAGDECLLEFGLEEIISKIKKLLR